MKQHVTDTLESQITNYIHGIQGKALEDTKVEISGEILFIFLSGIFSPMKEKQLLLKPFNEQRRGGLEKIVGSKIVESYESFKFNKEATCSVYIFEKKIKR